MDTVEIKVYNVLTTLRKTYRKHVATCSGVSRLYPVLVHLVEEVVQDLRLHAESAS
jgi:hypothetical protein